MNLNMQWRSQEIRRWGSNFGMGAHNITCAPKKQTIRFKIKGLKTQTKLLLRENKLLKFGCELNCHQN